MQRKDIVKLIADFAFDLQTKATMMIQLVPGFRCHQTAAYLVALFHSSPGGHAPDAFGQEGTWLVDLEANTFTPTPTIYLCCQKLVTRGAHYGNSHSFLVLVH